MAEEKDGQWYRRNWVAYQALPEAEQERIRQEWIAYDKHQKYLQLHVACGEDQDLTDRLNAGGVPYFHTIASSLPYQIFHDIAHVMIGSVAMGC